MYQQLVYRAAFAVSALALAACAQAPREANPRLTDPLPPPGQISPGPRAVAPQSAAPRPGAQDIVLRGAAYAVSGDGRFPPNSKMTVRVYDAAVGDVNNWAAEQSFTRSGVLPWPYTMRFRTEAMQGLRQPALAARIDGPDGRLIYQSEQVVPLSPGGSEDIPMSLVAGGNAAAARVTTDRYTDAPLTRGPEPIYGIPDYDSTYGAQTYDAPLYPGKSYQPTSLSGPPTNGVF